jgi:hypothetical protein
MSLAKDRLYRRIEKVLITVESMLIGVFFGFGFSLTDEGIWTDRLGVLIALIIFIIVNGYKRDVIKKERS